MMTFQISNLADDNRFSLLMHSVRNLPIVSVDDMELELKRFLANDPVQGILKSRAEDLLDSIRSARWLNAAEPSALFPAAFPSRFIAAVYGGKPG